MNNKMQEEIQKRLNDPNWDRKIAGKVIYAYHAEKENKIWILLPAAAAILLVFSLSLQIKSSFYNDQKSDDKIISVALMDYKSSGLPYEVDNFFAGLKK